MKFKELIPEIRPGHIVLAATVVITFLFIYFSYTSPFVTALRDGKRINGILIGTDWVDYARHSDTLIFVSYDPVERFMDIVSIPRDTHYSPKGYHFTRINEVFAYHYRTKKSDKAAAKELLTAVQDLMGNKVEIPYYFQVDYSSFKKFIDYLGGVRVEIEEPMNYDDNAGKLHIHFEPGTRVLDGQKALEYVRYRNQAGDIGRVFRQQKFLKAALSKWANPYTLTKMPQIVRMIAKEINTNLSFWDVLNGALELKDLKIKNIRVSQLPGKPKRNLWEPDNENISGLMDKVIPEKVARDIKEFHIRVEVWNASGTPGLADRTSWLLRKNGFDVIDSGNYITNQKKTLIKDLTGDIRPSQKLAEVLGCGEVVTRYDDKRLIDISVILGEDCKIK